MTAGRVAAARGTRSQPGAWNDAEVFVFDVEGTLVDAVIPKLRCWRETLATFGCAVTLADLHALSGMDGKLMLARLLPRVPAVERDEMIKRQGERFRAEYLRHLRAFPGVRELCGQLKESGRKTALATDCQRDELQHYFAITGIEPLVDAFVCGSDVKTGKPAPDLVLLALKRLRARTGPAVLIGDTPCDAQAARKAGIHPVGVLTGHFPEAVLREAGCEAVFRDVVRLGHVLEAASAQPALATLQPAPLDGGRLMAVLEKRKER